MARQIKLPNSFNKLNNAKPTTVGGAISSTQVGSFKTGFITSAAGSVMGSATAGLSTGLQIGDSAAFDHHILQIKYD